MKWLPHTKKALINLIAHLGHGFAFGSGSCSLLCKLLVRAFLSSCFLRSKSLFLSQNVDSNCSCT